MKAEQTNDIAKHKTLITLSGSGLWQRVEVPRRRLASSSPENAWLQMVGLN